MKAFLKATFTRHKFQGLVVGTALSNFAGYVAGSLVTVVSTRHVLEHRAVTNLFGFLPRKRVVVHLLPHWFEWVLALILGFLVMEAVRYAFSQLNCAGLLQALRTERARDGGGQASEQPRTADQESAGM